MRAIEDRCERLSLMEPLVIESGSPRRAELSDLAIDLAQQSAGLRRSLPSGLLSALADIVRSMNCYYSNLIEGHDTHPVDIERALKNDFSADAHRRDLQREAKAHIEVQRWIDAGSLVGHVFAQQSICEVHRRFYEALPDDLLWVDDPASKTRVRVIPGELRRRDVEVGAHLAVSPGAVPRFLSRYEEIYSRLGKAETVLAAAAAHHRLAWIHPFLDGNGRVARLISHASLLEVLDTGAAWSVSRGLARNVQAYKSHLAACDMPRRNDLDGRGHLSAEALVEFTRFFLTVCLDQVTFMGRLVEPRRLRARLMLWAEEEMRAGALPQKSGSILEAVIYRGELARADVAGIIGTGERQGRRVTAALIEKGVLASASSRALLRLAFPAALASRLMPGLFPEEPA